jgi:tRNA 5-methylaminomethyl-2-thiouridine biosynthesis bifunctional protein
LTNFANLKFDDNGVPISSDFDDIYYSKENGLDETDYVFVRHNALRARWQNMPDQPGQSFHIAETGFGTGLNFLVAWHNLRWANRLRRHPISLIFSSFEKYPLSYEDLKVALKTWSQLRFECQALLKAYPNQFDHDNIISLSLQDDFSHSGLAASNAQDKSSTSYASNHHITINLIIGDVNQQIGRTFLDEKSNGFKIPAVNAWFLDGFAPSKNPDMWQNSLYANMRRLSSPQCTVSTFTSVGHVRRGLIEAGFAMKKYPGFGHKRDMIASASVAPFITHDVKFSADKSPHLYFGTTPKRPPKEIAIIGGGIAGLMLADALITKSNDVQITLYCADQEVGQRGSSNRQGAVYPLLQSAYSALSLFYAEAYEFAIPYYRQLLSELPDIQHGWSGLLQQAINAEMPEKFKTIAKLWPEITTFKDAKKSSKLAGIQTPYPSLYFKDALWLNPQQLCISLKHKLQQSGQFTIKLNWPIADSLHELTDKFDATVICAGIDSVRLSLGDSLSLEGVVGQVSMTNSDALSELKTILCHKGYITPSNGFYQSFGATFEKQNEYQAELPIVSKQATVKNIDQIKKMYPEESWATGLDEVDVTGSNAAVRATTPDHLPMAGKLFDNDWLRQFVDQNNGKFKRLSKINRVIEDKFEGIYALTGLGARGLTSSPLLADMLSDLLLEGFAKTSVQTRFNVAPNRFQIKMMKQNKAN